MLGAFATQICTVPLPAPFPWRGVNPVGPPNICSNGWIGSNLQALSRDYDDAARAYQLVSALRPDFVPAAVDRKGPRRFLRGRLVRLGLPVLAGIFVLEPVSRLGFFLMPAGLTGITAAPTWSVYPELLGLGPLWFALLLLIFDTGYAAWRLSTTTRPPRSRTSATAASTASVSPQGGRCDTSVSW